MTTRAELTAGEQLQMRQGAERLKKRFEGQLNVESIERFLFDSLDQLLERARTTAWVPLLAERFATDRIRATIRLESDLTTLNPSVLFLCVHNAGRSQMAAGFMRALSGGAVDVFSGGSEPAESVNRAAVEAMAEKGIDIGREIPQPWADEIIKAADVVVTMGCGDACPIFPGKRYVDWELDDPAGKSVAEVRPIRDDLERRVRGLMTELGVEAV
ncbi:MAG TPA: arsenate reductase ArsC [Acidimicrobiia bacterium]|nr:arsenate reductase ArsC [Acidimicrobiia bacterium]